MDVGVLEMQRKFLWGRSFAAPFIYPDIFSGRVFSKSVNDFILALTEAVYGGCGMNERFFSLPTEKQQAIINAGYRVFSQNSYKNSPVSEIADAAGISKSLLFHYFHNKKELYMFLWDKCAEITIEYLTKYKCYEQNNLFESMERGMRAKMEIIRLYPDMANFTIRGFYEKDTDISADVQESCHKYFKFKANKTLLNDVAIFWDLEALFMLLFVQSVFSVKKKRTKQRIFC